MAQLAAWVVLDALSTPDPALPLWVEVPSALLAASLASYLVHRLGHANRWLWRLHGIHHAALGHGAARSPCPPRRAVRRAPLQPG